MENGKDSLTKAEMSSLKSRWSEKDPNTGETALTHMVKQLKTECKQPNFKRPLQLDLRGITLLHEDLSDLDLSGYDFSYANLNQEHCVCDIAVICNQTDSAISHQLRILRTLKIVKNRRQGKIIYYSIDDDHVASLINMSLKHVRH